MENPKYRIGDMVIFLRDKEKIPTQGIIKTADFSVGKNKWSYGFSIGAQYGRVNIFCWEEDVVKKIK